MPVLSQQLGPVGASRIGRETLGFRSRQMTPRVWLLEERHGKKGEPRWTLGLFFLPFSTKSNLFLPDLFTAIPTSPSLQPPSSTPSPPACTSNHHHLRGWVFWLSPKAPINMLNCSSWPAPHQSLLLFPEQLPQAGSGSSAPHTSSSRSNRKHRAGTACWVGPRRTTGQTVWLQEHGEKGGVWEEYVT